MIKKILLFICFSLFLQACDDDLSYRGGTRILMQGTIVNQGGAPLQGIPVSILVEKESHNGSFIWGGSNDDEDVISYTTTNSNGYYKMIIPWPDNQDNISLLINQDPEDRLNQEYSGTVITDITPDDAVDNTINFTEQGLFRLQDAVTLTVTLNNLPEYTYGKLLVNVDGLIYNNIISLNNTFYQPALLSTEYLNDYTAVRYTYTVAKNQSISFKYKRGGLDGETIEHTIPVANLPVNYSIDF